MFFSVSVFTSCEYRAKHVRLTFCQSFLFAFHFHNRFSNPNVLPIHLCFKSFYENLTICNTGCKLLKRSSASESLGRLNVVAGSFSYRPRAACHLPGLVQCRILISEDKMQPRRKKSAGIRLNCRFRLICKLKVRKYISLRSIICRDARSGGSL